MSIYMGIITGMGLKFQICKGLTSLVLSFMGIHGRSVPVTQMTVYMNLPVSSFQYAETYVIHAKFG